MPYLSDLINNHRSNERKIQLNMHVNFISSNDTGEIRITFVWSHNKENRSGHDTDDIIIGLFNSFFSN